MARIFTRSGSEYDLFFFLLTRMQSGIVKMINPTGGFGFIKLDNEQKEVFFHVTAVNGGDEVFKNLRDQKVTFDVEEGRKGPQAVNVSLAAGAANDADFDMAA